MKYQYTAIVEQEDGKDLGVYFPDVPGCVTAGSTPYEAFTNAKEALELHLEGMLEDGEDLPKASSYDDIKAQAPKGTHAILIVNAEPSVKVARVNIAIKENDLRRIDRYAEEHGMTRSGFLVNAALKGMNDRSHQKKA